MPTIGTTTCLVCGYDQMEPLELGIICPSCGTQYGISDEDMTYPELCRRWIHTSHARWWSRYTPEPLNWSPRNQLRNINYRFTPDDLRILTRGTTNETVTPIFAVRMDLTLLNYRAASSHSLSIGQPKAMKINPRRKVVYNTD